MKFGTQRFLGSLITNSSLKFMNSRWQTQYGEPKLKKKYPDEVWYSGGGGGTDHESEVIKTQKFELTI